MRLQDFLPQIKLAYIYYTYCDEKIKSKSATGKTFSIKFMIYPPKTRFYKAKNDYSRDNCFIPEAIDGSVTPAAGILIFLHLAASAKAPIASPETAAVIFWVFFS